MPSNPDIIEQVRRLVKLREKASSGPWDGDEDWLSCADGPLCYPDCLSTEDAAFIVAAGNLDFPALLAELTRLQRIEEAAKRYFGPHDGASLHALRRELERLVTI